MDEQLSLDREERMWAQIAARTTGRPLTADETLTALRAMRLDYRPDPDVEDGAWQARCPLCERRTLSAVEIGPSDDEDFRVPLVAISCSNGCSLSEIYRALSGDPAVLRARADAAAWQREAFAWKARYRWAMEMAQRLVGLS